MKYFCLALLSLSLSTKDGDHVKQFFAQFHRFYDKQALEMLEGFVEKAEVEAFEKNLKGVIEALNKTFKDAKISDLSFIVSRQPAQLKDACSKIMKDYAALALLQSGFDLKEAMKSLEQSPKEFKETIRFLGKAITGYLSYGLVKPAKIEVKGKDVINEIIGEKQFEYPQVFLRFISDNVFLTAYMSDSPYKGTESGVKSLVKEVYGDKTDKENPKDNEASFKGKKEAVAAYVRWNNIKWESSLDVLEKAMKLDEENAFYNYVHAYTCFNKGGKHQEQAIKDLKDGNKKKSVNFYNGEILGELASQFKGQMRYFLAQYQVNVKMLHGSWLTSVAQNTRFVFDKLVLDKRDKEGIELLEQGIQALDKCLEGSTLFLEISPIVSTQISLLETKANYFKDAKNEKKYIEAQRQLSRAQWLKFAMDFSMTYDVHLVILLQTLFLDEEELPKAWEKLRKDGFDRWLVKKCEIKFKETVIDKLLKEKPQLGGNIDDETYVKAKELLKNKKYRECVEKIDELLMREPDHLNALLLKQEALDNIK